MRLKYKEAMWWFWRLVKENCSTGYFAGVCNKISLEFNKGIFIVFSGLIRKIHKTFSGLILWHINIQIIHEVLVGVWFYSRKLNRLFSGCLPLYTPTSDPHCHMWLFISILKILQRKILDNSPCDCHYFHCLISIFYAVA